MLPTPGLCILAFFLRRPPIFRQIAKTWLAKPALALLYSAPSPHHSQGARNRNGLHLNETAQNNTRPPSIFEQHTWNLNLLIEVMNVNRMTGRCNRHDGELAWRVSAVSE